MAWLSVACVVFILTCVVYLYLHVSYTHILYLWAVLRWESTGKPHHAWQTMLAAKRKELQRLNGAYKVTFTFDCML